MERREMLTAALGGIGGNWAVHALGSMPKTGEYLAVVHLNVGQLPPFKAEALMDRIKDKLRKEKPDSGFEFFFLPTRSQPTTIEIYEFDGREILEGGKYTERRAWLENFVKDAVKLRADFVEICEDTDEQIKAYVKMLFGAPVRELPADLDAQIDEAITAGRHFMVSNLRTFVYDYVDTQHWYHWKRELRRQYIEYAGWTPEEVDNAQIDYDAYRCYYDQGETPLNALIEDMGYWDGEPTV